ncbi:MAG: ABC transporter permease [Planctomycetaceae bacterium]|nr:ABC transporter permease [Planctomycetaceae bacterium]
MLKFAVRNLFSRPMRSLLSLLGLTVAIIGMVGLFSVARGLDRLVSSTFERLHGLIAMQPGAPVPLFSHLPASWGDEIAGLPGVEYVSPEVWSRVNVIDEKMILSPPRFLFGTDIATRLKLKQRIYQDDIVAGRFLTLDDRNTFNAVISRQIAEEFEKGVGDTLRVNGQDVTIVGIYHCGSLLLDIAIILDIDVVRGMTRFDPGSVSSFYIEPTGAADEERLQKEIPKLFRGRSNDVKPWISTAAKSLSVPSGNGLLDLVRFFQNWFLETAPPKLPPGVAPVPPDGSGNGTSPSSDASKRSPSKARNVKLSVTETGPIEVKSVAEFGERIDKMADDLDVFLTVLTSIGVTIAVLSIVNTMLMSVTERIIEFGILKANGWTKTDVLKLITFESGLLGVAGGVFGSLFGWAGTHVVNAAWPTRVTLYASPGLLLFAVVFSTVLGVLGGLYPALWAMRLMPMDAIRRG